MRAANATNHITNMASSNTDDDILASSLVSVSSNAINCVNN